MNLVDRIKETANKRGMTLNDLSVKAGVGPKTISNWRNHNPQSATIQKVADVLGVSVDYLLGNTDDMYANTDKPKLDIKEVAEKDSWDEYLSSDGRPLSEHDKKVLRALFGE